MRFHTIRSLVSLTLSFAIVSPAFASGMSQASEPSDGFMKGGNLEWSSAHTSGKASSTEHRAYHKTGEAERVLWLKENLAPAMRMNSYNAAYRAFMQKRNLMHRQWHLERSGLSKPDAVLHFTIPTVFSTEFTITIVEPPLTATNSHVLLGTKLSRRSIVMETEKQQKIHALSIGQQ